DRGVQYLAIRYTERLAENGAVSSVGSRGDSFDNAMAESIIGLYKTELVRNRGPWRGLDDLEPVHPGMGRLVQPQAALPRTRPHPTHRIREAPLPSNRVRPSGRHSHDRACMKPGEVHRRLRSRHSSSILGALRHQTVRVRRSGGGSLHNPLDTPAPAQLTPNAQ